MSDPASVPAAERPENPWISLLVNIAIPALVLMKLSGEDLLGPVYGLVVALVFPLAYGVADLFRRHKVNFISVLGVVSILLTGGIGLLQLDPKWIAVKEATVPLVIGLAVVISLKTPYPIVRTMLYNDKIIDIPTVEAHLAQYGTARAFERTLVNASWLLAASFFVSAVLNFILARVIVKSPAGSVAFNEELGRMTALSYPVIVLPSMAVMFVAMWYLFRSIRRLTHMKLEDIFHPRHKND